MKNLHKVFNRIVTDFWNEVKKLRGRKSCSPTNIDSIKGDDNINGLFSNKYKNLYNSVSYDVNQMNILKTHVSNEIVSHSCESHTVMVHNVVSSVKLLKIRKARWKQRPLYQSFNTWNAQITLFYIYLI